jgi:hypothetical protein
MRDKALKVAVGIVYEVILPSGGYVINDRTSISAMLKRHEFDVTLTS